MSHPYVMEPVSGTVPRRAVWLGAALAALVSLAGAVGAAIRWMPAAPRWLLPDDLRMVPGVGFPIDAWPLVALLWLLLMVPAMAVAVRVVPDLLARYDAAAMSPTPPQAVRLHTVGPVGPAQQAAWQALQAWCRRGMGDGRSPFLMPWRRPVPPQAVTLAVLRGPRHAGKTHLAAAFMLALSRDDELATQRGGLGRSLLRLGVKLRELQWWRRRAPHQAWDCGHVTEGPAGRLALLGFRPRRPTLLVLDEPTVRQLDDCMAVLRSQRAAFRQPVRLLVLEHAPTTVLEVLTPTTSLTL